MSVEIFALVWAWIVFVCVQAMDVNSTVKVIALGGVERNRVMRWVMGKLGVVKGLVTAKLVMMIVVAAGTSVVGDTWGDIGSLGIMIAADIFYFVLWTRNEKVVKELEERR